MTYLVIVFDIKDSRKIANREALQYKLIDTIKEANQLYSNIIVRDFIITIGDEWQGLFKYPCDFQKVIDFFNRRLVDTSFYCGIGVGTISIHNFELTVNQLDGPAFHLARDAIKLAKQKNLPFVMLGDWLL